MDSRCGRQRMAPSDLLGMSVPDNEPSDNRAKRHGTANLTWPCRDERRVRLLRLEDSYVRRFPWAEYREPGGARWKERVS